MGRIRSESGPSGFARWMLAGVTTTLLLSGFAVLIVIAFLWWQAYRGSADSRRDQQGPPTTVDDRQKLIGQQLDAYKAQLDAFKTQTDDLQRLTALLVGLSSFYAVVLGATSYLTAQQFVDRMKSDADRVEGKAKDLEKNYPIFTDFAKNIEDGINRLLDKFPIDEERDQYYTRLSESDKERILFSERSMGFLDYLDVPSKTARLYHGLGMFYSGRYSIEKSQLESLESSEEKKGCTKLQLDDKRASAREVCMRARFYLEMAVERDRKNYVAMNDLGLVLEDLAHLEERDAAKTVYQHQAEELFRDSYQSQRQQQRALYNLARVLASRKDYNGAIMQLSEALGQVNWQTKPNTLRVKDIRYNRACYRCRLAESSETRQNIGEQSLLEEVKLDFNAVFDSSYTADPVVRKETLKTLQADIMPGGELALLQDKEPTLIAAALNLLQNVSN